MLALRRELQKSRRFLFVKVDSRLCFSSLQGLRLHISAIVYGLGCGKLTEERRRRHAVAVTIATQLTYITIRPQITMATATERFLAMFGTREADWQHQSVTYWTLDEQLPLRPSTAPSSHNHVSRIESMHAAVRSRRASAATGSGDSDDGIGLWRPGRPRPVFDAVFSSIVSGDAALDLAGAAGLRPPIRIPSASSSGSLSVCASRPSAISSKHDRASETHTEAPTVADCALEDVGLLRPPAPVFTTDALALQLREWREVRHPAPPQPTTLFPDQSALAAAIPSEVDVSRGWRPATADPASIRALAARATGENAGLKLTACGSNGTKGSAGVRGVVKGVGLAKTRVSLSQLAGHYAHPFSAPGAAASAVPGPRSMAVAVSQDDARLRQVKYVFGKGAKGQGLQDARAVSAGGTSTPRAHADGMPSAGTSTTRKARSASAGFAAEVRASAAASLAGDMAQRQAERAVARTLVEMRATLGVQPGTFTGGSALGGLDAAAAPLATAVSLLTARSQPGVSRVTASLAPASGARGGEPIVPCADPWLDESSDRDSCEDSRGAEELDDAGDVYEGGSGDMGLGLNRAASARARAAEAERGFYVTADTAGGREAAQAVLLSRLLEAHHQLTVYPGPLPLHETAALKPAPRPATAAPTVGAVQPLVSLSLVGTALRRQDTTPASPPDKLSPSQAFYAQVRSCQLDLATKLPLKALWHKAPPMPGGASDDTAESRGYVAGATLARVRSILEGTHAQAGGERSRQLAAQQKARHDSAWRRAQVVLQSALLTDIAACTARLVDATVLQPRMRQCDALFAPLKRGSVAHAGSASGTVASAASTDTSSSSTGSADMNELLLRWQPTPATAVSPDTDGLAARCVTGWTRIEAELQRERAAGLAATRPLALLLLRSTVEGALRTRYPHVWLVDASLACYVRTYGPPVGLAPAHVDDDIAGGTMTVSEGISSALSLMTTWRPLHVEIDRAVTALLDPSGAGSQIPAVMADARAHEAQRQAVAEARRAKLQERQALPGAGSTADPRPGSAGSVRPGSAMSRRPSKAFLSGPVTGVVIAPAPSSRARSPGAAPVTPSLGPCVAGTLSVRPSTAPAGGRGAVGRETSRTVAAIVTQRRASIALELGRDALVAGGALAPLPPAHASKHAQIELSRMLQQPSFSLQALPYRLAEQPELRAAVVSAAISKVASRYASAGGNPEVRGELAMMIGKSKVTCLPL